MHENDLYDYFSILHHFSLSFRDHQRDVQTNVCLFTCSLSIFSITDPHGPTWTHTNPPSETDPQWTHRHPRTHADPRRPTWTLNGTWWNMMEFARNSRNVPEGHGISWNVTECDGMSRNVTEPYGMSRKVMEHHGIPWKFMESHGISWKVLEKKPE